MKRAALALALCSTAGAAWADCPTTLADAAEGVYADFDGYIVRYDRRPDGTVEEVEFDTTDGSGYFYRSHQGIMIHESWEMSAGFLQADTHEVITYDQPLPATIAPNSTFSTMTTVQYATDAPYQEPLTISAGATVSEQIGDCVMQVVPVQMRTGPGNDQFVSNFSYFPALGFGVFIGGHGANEAPEFFRPTYIGTVPPTAGGAAAPATPAPAAPAAPASK